MLYISIYLEIIEKSQGNEVFKLTGQKKNTFSKVIE